MPVYFYGSRQEHLDCLIRNHRERFPELKIAGVEPFKVGRTTPKEKAEIARRIRESGARITFVGLGCPRQEVFAYEYCDLLAMPVIAVGVAFDYQAGLLDEPPVIQQAGLQWLYRLTQDPHRLWRRYLLLNPAFLTLLALQTSQLWQPNPSATDQPTGELRYG